MDFLNEIKQETIILCNRADKTTILKRNKLINVKVMSIEQFREKYCFSFFEDAILYVMQRFGVKYDIALEYINNLYYVEDKKYAVKKLDFLVDLKRELDEKGLLLYNPLFRKYVQNLKVIVYGIHLSPFDERMLSGINYQYIPKKYNTYTHTVYSFATLEEEVEYVAFNICKLLEEGVSVKNIKLTNIGTDYYATIYRIFSLYGLKVNLPNTSPLSSFPYVSNFINLYKENDLEYAIQQIDSHHELYDSIIEVVNRYLSYGSKDLILYKLEHTNIESYKYDNGIEIVDYLEYEAGDDDYVFMMSFNDGIVPNSYKDIDYITDNIKDLVYLESTHVKNTRLREDILNAMHTIKNLTITYKLRDTKKTFYPSSLCSYFNCEAGHIEGNISYSEVYNKIKLTRSIDNFIKYGYKDKQFDILRSNFSVDYNSFDNAYSPIHRVMDKLTLSYSKMQMYNKCAFRYYLSHILKLDIFEEKFQAVIGSMVHYVMEKCLSNDSMDTDKYVKEFLKDREFSKKELFFLEKYKVCIKELLDQVLLEREYSSFTGAMYEKQVDIDYGNNVKFTGIIDKVLYKEDNDKTYVALVDYKTGQDEISLGYLKYGINIQLPIYLYLANYLHLRNVLYCGFYLQKFNINKKDYRLEGYSNSDRDILSVIDNNYECSNIIKGMKTLKSGEFAKYAKVLNNEEIQKIIDITKRKIEEVIDNIEKNKFDINPKVDGDKNIGCDFCKFRDICFVKKKDKVSITSEEFGGEE